MTNRFLLKQFAENGDKGVFGSYQAGNKTVSSDPATLQSLTAWTNGWADAISNGSHLPAMEEFQAVQYLICKAVKELYSEGIPVWMEGETYYKGAICSYIDSEGNVALYKNITGNNGVQQPALDIINWATFSAGGGGASAGGQMFDVVQKDHSLTFDESKGYVPLGGYAYKEGVSGSRYGYPTFYETCVSEYQAGVAEQMTIGSDTITVKRNSNGHVYYDIADKSIVDTLYADTGIAWMYGIDTTSERIALPRNDYMARGEKGIVGNGMTLGLTNGSDNVGIGPSSSDHRLFPSTSVYGSNVGSGLGGAIGGQLSLGVTTDPTKSGIERVKDGSDKHLYMICGTTEEEVAMTEVTEVTTSENDTIPLFTHKYFEFKPNHISWVPANTVQSGSVYTSAYNTLVDCLTDNPYEIKVIDEADEQVGVDYSEYWIVNQTNETFRTPITVSEKALTGAVSGSAVEVADSLLYFKVDNAVQNLQLIDAGRIEENKADINASNFTQTGKETITSWGGIDSTSGVSATQGIVYTASYNCFLYAEVHSLSGSANTEISKSIVIDGNVVATATAFYYNTIPIMVRCAKGSTYEFRNVRAGSGTYTFIVYQCIGG